MLPWFCVRLLIPELTFTIAFFGPFFFRAAGGTAPQSAGAVTFVLRIARSCSYEKLYASSCQALSACVRTWNSIRVVVQFRRCRRGNPARARRGPPRPGRRWRGCFPRPSHRARWGAVRSPRRTAEPSAGRQSQGPLRRQPVGCSVQQQPGERAPGRSRATHCKRVRLVSAVGRVRVGRGRLTQ